MLMLDAYCEILLKETKFCHLIFLSLLLLYFFQCDLYPRNFLRLITKHSKMKELKYENKHLQIHWNFRLLFYEETDENWKNEKSHCKDFNFYVSAIYWL